MGIDWHDQWKLFAPGFKEGHLPLRFTLPSRVEEVRLYPGPGFGDLSHPTTQLMLELMGSRVVRQSVFDIGAGSGILSFAAYALFAKEVVGVDIDLEAVSHARLNALKNGWEKEVKFYLPEKQLPPFSRGVILMNMISSEQEIAWESFPRLSVFEGDLIISGILESEEKRAVSRFTKRGWELQERSSLKEWIALRFSK